MDSPQPKMEKFTSLETVRVLAHRGGVYELRLNRPHKMNAMNTLFWEEFNRAALRLAENRADVRAVVVSGEGSHFSTGLDVHEFATILQGPDEEEDHARSNLELRERIVHMQSAFTALEAIPAPVIGLGHGYCYGSAVDLLAACDIRYASKDAVFSVREVRVGLAADVGTLQRVPHVIGNHSLFRELCFTGEDFDSRVAMEMGLVSKPPGSVELPESKDDALKAGLQLAAKIAANSPLAVMGTKRYLLRARDRPHVGEGLEDMATWNASALRTRDLSEGAFAKAEHRKPVYSRL